MKKSKKITSIVFCCLCLCCMMLLVCSCKTHHKFEKMKWNVKDDMGIYIYREQMLYDLMHHHQLKGLSYNHVVDLIGTPENRSHKSGNKVFYNIVKKFNNDIVPNYTKSLMLQLNSDS